MLFDRQLKVLEDLVGLGLAVGADLLLGDDFHGVAGTRFHADVAARRFDLERAAWLDREGLFNRPFDLGVENDRGGKKPPDSDDKREMEFHDWKAGLQHREPAGAPKVTDNLYRRQDSASGGTPRASSLRLTA